MLSDRRGEQVHGPTPIGEGGRLYQIGETYTVADDGGWLPGVYPTPEAAERALDRRRQWRLAQTRHPR